MMGRISLAVTQYFGGDRAGDLGDRQVPWQVAGSGKCGQGGVGSAGADF